MWNGKLFVWKDEQGEGQVATSVPEYLDKSKLKAYRVVGPFVPVGWGKPAAVGDASRWIDDLKHRGFSVDPCSVD